MKTRNEKKNPLHQIYVKPLLFLHVCEQCILFVSDVYIYEKTHFEAPLLISRSYNSGSNMGMDV